MSSLAKRTGSLGTDFYRFFLYRRRNGLVVLLEALKVTVDRVLDVIQRFSSRFALRNAPRKRWNTGGSTPVR